MGDACAVLPCEIFMILMKSYRAIFTAIALLSASMVSNAEVYFKTPSGNVICGGDMAHSTSGVTCDIRERASDKPIKPMPDWCPLDWGGRFTLNRKKAELECYSDYPYIHPDEMMVLNYGQTVRGNGWSCTSQKSGLTCKNTRGRGFFLSRKRQRIF